MRSCILRIILVHIYFLTEFKRVLLIKIIYGRAAHPPSWALVEQANGVVKTNLYCLLTDYKGKSQSDVLPDIALRMNRQTHSTIRPYEILIRGLDRKNKLSQLQIFKFIRLRKYFLIGQKKRLLMTRYDLGLYIIFWLTFSNITQLPPQRIVSRAASPEVPQADLSLTPIDPAILNSIAVTPSIVLTAAERSIVAALEKSHEKMAEHYNK